MKTFDLEALRGMAYPGRGIILGLDSSGTRWAIAYFLTGRSGSSRARRLEREGDAVWTRPTDAEALGRGNPELLIYPAIIAARGMAVSNGRQTADIAAGLAPGRSPREVLESALSGWDYEPDGPIFTPRISGCLTEDGRAAMSLLARREDGSTARAVFDVPSVPGRGSLLTTYAGDPENVRSFAGPPLVVRLGFSSPESLAEAVDEALAPRRGAPDLRVAVAGLLASPGDPSGLETAIINRRERESAHG
jgi:IMP cyclohydrolase